MRAASSRVPSPLRGSKRPTKRMRGGPGGRSSSARRGRYSSVSTPFGMIWKGWSRKYGRSAVMHASDTAIMRSVLATVLRT